MADRKLDFDELVGRVSDGDDVDWSEAERDATTEEELRLVDNLQVIAGVGAAHRGQDAAPLTPGELLEMTSSLDPAALTEVAAAGGEPFETASDASGLRPERPEAEVVGASSRLPLVVVLSAAALLLVLIVLLSLGWL